MSLPVAAGFEIDDLLRHFHALLWCAHARTLHRRTGRHSPPALQDHSIQLLRVQIGRRCDDCEPAEAGGGKGGNRRMKETVGGRGARRLDAGPARQLSRTEVVLIIAGILAAQAIVLYLMGHPLICTCGSVKLWHFDVESAENSQHLFDWYSPSHLIHGFLFYWLLTLASRYIPMSFALRLALAVAVEATWEVIENTDFVINHYREATISLDYYGDSVVNSISDTLIM